MRVHVYPINEKALHNIFGGGADCYCEPEVMDLGDDKTGQPARVFKHRRLLGRPEPGQGAMAHLTLER